jgi:hypothetical protein
VRGYDKVWFTDGTKTTLWTWPVFF